jgi:hypothetical protein
LLFNVSARRLLKQLGVTGQRGDRACDARAVEGRSLARRRGDEALEVTATVAVRGLLRDVVVTETIALS